MTRSAWTRSDINRSDAGTALILKGTSFGLFDTGVVAVSQDTSGIPGSTETADKLGSAVSLTNLSGYGRTDPVIGTEGEDAGNGALLHIPSNSTGLGVSTSVNYGKTQLGAATGVRLGTTLTR
ncbi:hypothetical protein ACNPQM_05330 [Streptomyces sp. NPDC056231]|uniref:hypothetical protein n=1 Tax=Streptomyces sp. NPDC056231 TaxID=3345755 RepID=UPI003AABD4C9